MTLFFFNLATQHAPLSSAVDHTHINVIDIQIVTEFAFKNIYYVSNN